MPVYKNEERNSWFCSFYYTDWTGKKKRKKKEGFATRREAKEYERKFLETYVGTPDITFDTLSESYFKSAETRIKPQSLYAKRSIYRNNIAPYFGSAVVRDITPASINSWQERLVKEGYKGGYINSIHTLLSSIFNYAMKFYGLKSNPAFVVRGVGKSPKKIDFWTLEEFHKFAMTLKKPVYIVAFYVLFWTGMRVGELLALTWDDVDLKANTITIDKTLYRAGKERYIGTPKTATSSRIVTIPSFLSLMLQDYKHIGKYITEDRIIPVRSYTLTRKLTSGAEKAGVKRIRVHDLRHSHASMLIKMKCDPVQVADRLGHKDPSITLKVYAHMYASQRKEIANMLESVYE